MISIEKIFGSPDE